MSKVHRIQELRRSNAATPTRNKKKYRRANFQEDMMKARSEQFFVGSSQPNTTTAANKA